MNTFFVQNKLNPSVPEVILDADSGKCVISGNSYMEDSREFYQAIIEWITTYVQEKKGVLEWEFKLGYYNSSSRKSLAHVINLLGKYHLSGGQVAINWYYHADDLDMLEDVEDFISSSQLEITPLLYPANQQETMFFKRKVSKNHLV